MIRSKMDEKMDLEGHYPRNTISHCIISNETPITVHFFSGSNFCYTRDKSRFILGNIVIILKVLLFWFPAGQDLIKKLILVLF